MNGLNIIFGSAKTGRTNSTSEFNYPVIKVEASRGPRTGKRVLFNTKASQLLGLDAGETQEMLFGFAFDTDKNRLFLINTAEFANEVQDKTYKTSKNRVSYTDSSEKGKAITSGALVDELRQFLDIPESLDYNMEVSTYSDEGEATIYELKQITASTEETTLEEDLEVEAQVVVDTFVSDSLNEDVNSETGFADSTEETISEESIIDTNFFG